MSPDEAELKQRAVEALPAAVQVLVVSRRRRVSVQEPGAMMWPVETAVAMRPPLVLASARPVPLRERAVELRRPQAAAEEKPTLRAAAERTVRMQQAQERAVPR
jgi:hypothetical protein